MPQVPLLKPQIVVKAFEQLGWEVARGTLRGLLNRAGLSVEEFYDVLTLKYQAGLK